MVMVVVTENISGRCWRKIATTVAIDEIVHSEYGNARTINGDETKFGRIVRADNKKSFTYSL